MLEKVAGLFLNRRIERRRLPCCGEAVFRMKCKLVCVYRVLYENREQPAHVSNG